MTVVVVAPETADVAKARGAFYTPPAVAAFLARWAVRTSEDRVLEPSAGDGAFLRALRDRFHDLGQDDIAGRILAIERETAEADKARLIAPLSALPRSPIPDPLFIPAWHSSPGTPRDRRSRGAP